VEIDNDHTYGCDLISPIIICVINQIFVLNYQYSSYFHLRPRRRYHAICVRIASLRTRHRQLVVAISGKEGGEGITIGRGTILATIVAATAFEYAPKQP
jgi:hypothetical protein